MTVGQRSYAQTTILTSQQRPYMDQLTAAPERMPSRNGMPNRGKVLTMKHHEFSLRSQLMIALFVIMLVAVVFVDLIGVLEYFNLVSESPVTSTLETGALVSAAIAVPFLAMGMSISTDQNKKWDLVCSRRT
jgi:hypothetical protein